MKIPSMALLFWMRPRLNSQQRFAAIFLGPWGHDRIGCEAPAYSHIHSTTPAKAQGSPDPSGILTSHWSPRGESRILFTNNTAKAGSCAAIPGQHCDLLQRPGHRHMLHKHDIPQLHITKLPSPPQCGRGGRSTGMKGASVTVLEWDPTPVASSSQRGCRALLPTGTEAPLAGPKTRLGEHRGAPTQLHPALEKPTPLWCPRANTHPAERRSGLPEEEHNNTLNRTRKETA